MKTHEYTDFPLDIKKHVWDIHPRMNVVDVDGFKRFNLVELKNIPLNKRLSFPHELFVAIHEAKP